MSKKSFAASILGAAFGIGLCVSGAFAGETVKIALIDPMSGPFAVVGQNIVKTFQFGAEKASKENKAGLSYEIGTFDNKGSPQETISLLNTAIDQGYRYVTQGLGTALAMAIVDFLNKYNERNPGKEVLFLDYAAADPDLTGAKCSYWHFRFEADTSTKMVALTSYIKDRPEIKKVYLLNQNYAHGQQFAKYATKYLAQTRPDIEIVGEDLVPIGQVKDFAPYMAKVKAAGADAVMSGNWGPDLSLMIKAAKESGLGVTFFTPQAMGVGNATAIGAAGEGKVKTAYPSNPNVPGEMGALVKEFKARFNEDYAMPQPYQLFKLMNAATEKAGSAEPIKVAKALEGLTVKSFNGDITMRADDHQIQQGLYISTWAKPDDKNSYNVENTGFTWAIEKFYDPASVSTPNACTMKRPN